MTAMPAKIDSAEPIEAVEIIPPAPARSFPDGINPAWDIAQIATPGHVLTERVSALTYKLLTPMTMCGVAALATVSAIFVPPMALKAGYFTSVAAVALSPFVFKRFGGDYSFSLPKTLGLAAALVAAVSVSYGTAMFAKMGGTPAFLQAAFTYDPDSYFDIGGGIKTGPEMAWLAQYAPKPESLSESDWEALVKATVSDLSAYGTDAAKWQAVGGLKTKPIVTRIEKVIANNADRLKDGAIAVPTSGRVTPIIAHVRGQWAVAMTAPGGCAVFMGPMVAGCQDNTNKQFPLTSDVRGVFARMKPTASKE